MKLIEAQQIIFNELMKVYDLCKLVPTQSEWQIFLELQPDYFVKQFGAFPVDIAYKELFLFKHWYNRKYNAANIDTLMKIQLDAIDLRLYPLYLRYYVKNLEA